MSDDAHPQVLMEAVARRVAVLRSLTDGSSVRFLDLIDRWLEISTQQDEAALLLLLSDLEALLKESIRDGPST